MSTKNSRKEIIRARGVTFDFTSNALKNLGIRKQVKEQWTSYFVKSLPDMIKREMKVKAFITDKMGDYHKLLREARVCYRNGFFHSCIAMVGITAERFAVEASENLDFKINDIKTSEKELFDKELSQYRRLRILLKAKILNSEEFDKLDKIRDIRNKYIHFKESKNPARDALKVLNLMYEVITRIEAIHKTRS